MTLKLPSPRQNSKPSLLTTFQNASNTIDAIFTSHTQNTNPNPNTNTESNGTNNSKPSSTNSSLISQQFHTQFGTISETEQHIEESSTKHITTYSNLLSKIKLSLPHNTPPLSYTKMNTLNKLKLYQQQVQQSKGFLKSKQSSLSQLSDSEPFVSRQTLPNTTDRNETNSHFYAYSNLNNTELVFDDINEEQANQVKSQRYRMKDINEENVENANGHELMQGDKHCLRQMKIKKIDFTVKKRRTHLTHKASYSMQCLNGERNRIIRAHTTMNNDNNNNNVKEDSFYKDDRSVERYGVNYCQTCASCNDDNTERKCVVF